MLQVLEGSVLHFTFSISLSNKIVKMLSNPIVLKAWIEFYHLYCQRCLELNYIFGFIQPNKTEQHYCSTIWKTLFEIRKTKHFSRMIKHYCSNKIFFLKLVKRPSHFWYLNSDKYAPNSKRLTVLQIKSAFMEKFYAWHDIFVPRGLKIVKTFNAWFIQVQHSTQTTRKLEKEFKCNFGMKSWSILRQFSLSPTL